MLHKILAKLFAPPASRYWLAAAGVVSYGGSVACFLKAAITASWVPRVGFVVLGLLCFAVSFWVLTSLAEYGK